MPLLFILEFRPLRYLLYVFTFGGVLGAQRGDMRGVVMAAIGAALLWPHLVVETVRLIVGMAAWMRDRLAQ